MNIGLVVSTLGRTEPLERLLRSLTDQLTGDDHVVIVAQQRLAEVTALANRFRDAPWPITVTTCAPAGAEPSAWPPSHRAIGCCTSPATRRGFRPAPSRPCERQWGTERVVSVP